MFLCFLNTVEFLTHYYISHLVQLSLLIVTSVCQLLLWEWFCSSILLTEYKQKWRKSIVLFESFNKKRKTLRQITALSLRIFTINTLILFLKLQFSDYTLPNLHKANVGNRQCNTIHLNEKSVNYTGFFDSPCFLCRTSCWQQNILFVM